MCHQYQRHTRRSRNSSFNIKRTIKNVKLETNLRHAREKNVLKKLLGLSLTKLQLFAARVRCQQYALSAYASSRAPPIRINLNLPFRVLNEAGTRWSGNKFLTSFYYCITHKYFFTASLVESSNKLLPLIVLKKWFREYAIELCMENLKAEIQFSWYWKQKCIS